MKPMRKRNLKIFAAMARQIEAHFEAQQILDDCWHKTANPVASEILKHALKHLSWPAPPVPDQTKEKEETK